MQRWNCTYQSSEPHNSSENLYFCSPSLSWGKFSQVYRCDVMVWIWVRPGITISLYKKVKILCNFFVNLYLTNFSKYINIKDTHLIQLYIIWIRWSTKLWTAATMSKSNVQYIPNENEIKCTQW